MKKQTRRIVALICTFIISIGMTLPVSAATTPEGDVSVQASDYLEEYTAWASAGSDGKIYVYYSVDGTGYIARLGAKLIIVQMEDAGEWTDVQTITGTVTNGMLGQNKTSHSGNIVHQGTDGNTYRAVVTIYGGPATGGDSRIITTNTVVAKGP